ncbi:zinc finger MYM-type protein 1-like [Oratosquilla oratoria]|uniref:zinc finger MYM-type protein 1-like n=1 Tax=Oratosquilla oratoria TaxID=337810 RepID=UPI003F75DD83
MSLAVQSNAVIVYLLVITTSSQPISEVILISLASSEFSLMLHGLTSLCSIIGILNILWVVRPPCKTEAAIPEEATANAISLFARLYKMSLLTASLQLKALHKLRNILWGSFKKLKELNIPFENCKGQSYDNGANMKGKNKGVQARLLQLNPRSLFVPCGAHTVNLVVCDAAKSSSYATAYFGYLQKLFNLFSASTQRWSTLKKHVDITLKSWADTRWESRINSVEVVRFQAAKVREALLEVRASTADPAIKIEVQALAEEVGSYRFSICTVVWYDILRKVQTVNKLLQSQCMHLDVAVDILKKDETSLVSYRDTGFADAQTSVKDVCEEMNVEAALKQKRLRTTKRQFSYEAFHEPITDALKKMEFSFFNVVVDVAIESLRERTGMMTSELEKQAKYLCNTLTSGDQADLNYDELIVEMQSFPKQWPKQNMTTLDLVFLEEKGLKEIYPNMWVALRIAVTTPVTVASAERSFSKLKLIKTYLRSTMSQERLNGLAIISIDREISKQVSYDDTIDDFAARKSRRVDVLDMQFGKHEPSKH